jgi:hypothetical protein
MSFVHAFEEVLADGRVVIRQAGDGDLRSLAVVALQPTRDCDTGGDHEMSYMEAKTPERREHMTVERAGGGILDQIDRAFPSEMSTPAFR